MTCCWGRNERAVELPPAIFWETYRPPVNSQTFLGVSNRMDYRDDVIGVESCRFVLYKVKTEA